MYKYLDVRSYVCIEGGAETIQTLLELKWDFIIFTGSTEKGKLVYQAAAQNLTPVILELGGQCPVVVDQKVDLKDAALKIVQGKTLNCGQACISPDYVFVHQSIQEKFI